MKFSKPFTILANDVEKVGALVESRRSDWFVMDRQKWNVNGPSPLFNREDFWHDLVGCLLSTQQPSTQGSPVERFMELKPFPLTLEACSQEIEKHIASVLQRFGGIRMWPTIARRSKENYEWLNSGGWA